jgi:periplasmic glucans biosynthesis protein
MLLMRNGPISRATVERSIACAAALACLFWCRTAPAFDFEGVAKRAQLLSLSPFKQQDSNVPKDLQSLDYEHYRAIRFRAERALWRSAGLAFELEFFHQGRYYNQPVKINEVRADGVREIRFQPEMFDYGANKVAAKDLRDLGFAGFRVHFPVNSPKYKDEVLSFLGASYFRGLGKHQRYGTSARAVAVDTAASWGEEFPRFVEFWIERPTPVAKKLTIYGLLDSPRVAGAYRFILTPGVDTVLEVKARLYFRKNIGKLGVAPLTSMFLFGENQPSTLEDYRPEVHDSDGLSVHAGSDEWIWRPLVNPKRLLVTSFATTNPKGFGLMQRDRDFADYQDTDSRYELRPSAWVEPQGAWGAGRIELVQIPVPDETNDNIVAYWVPENWPQPKQPYDFEYRLLWQKDAETRPPLAWIMQTRRGRGRVTKGDSGITFVIDFADPRPNGSAFDAQPENIVWVDANGKVLGNTLSRNEVTGGWRATLHVRRVDEKQSMELRSTLRAGNRPVSETWSYVLPPE